MAYVLSRIFCLTEPVTCRRLTEKAISGIELARKVKKGQFNLQCLRKRAGDVHDLWVATIMA
jgi:hypothetical protein